MFDRPLPALVSLLALLAMLQAQEVSRAHLVPMARLAACVCPAQEDHLAFSPEPPALQCAKPVLQESRALQDPRSTLLFAQQARTAWLTEAQLRVTPVFSAQQERNSFRTTTPPALRECTALLALPLFAAPLAHTLP